MADNSYNNIDMNVVIRADTTGLEPAVEKLGEAQEYVDKIQHADLSMPNLSRLTTSAVNSAKFVTENTRERAKNFGNEATEYDQARAARRLEHSYKEAGAMLNLYAGDKTAFSLSRQKSFMDSLGDDMKKLLDSTTVELANLIKTVTSDDYKGLGKVRERDMKRFAQSFENANPNEASRIFSKVRGAKGYTGDIEKQFIEYVAARTLAPTYFNDYSRERFGRNITAHTLDFEMSDLLPKRYLESWRNQQTTYRSSPSENDRTRYLKKQQLKILDEELSQDPLLVQSAIEAGIATRKKNGKLERFENISAAQIERLRETSYENLMSSAIGFLDKETFFKDRERAVKRVASGNSGRLLASMSRLEDFGADAYYSPASNVDTDTTIAIDEPKRVKKMYGSLKVNLATGQEKQNAINESQITSLLGYDRLKNHSDVSDEMLTLELGSDYEAVKDKIAEIRKNGYVRNGIKYRFHAAHRSDEGVDLRMLSEAAMDRTNKQYAYLAEQMGLPGRNILDLFEDPKSFSDYAINGKHNDAINKLYTDSYIMSPGKNFDNKVAIIDTSSIKDDGLKQVLADGIMYAAKGLFSSSGQIRTALAGKGTLRSVGGEDDTTLRRYLIDSGLATYEGEKPKDWSYDDENWHYYVKGVGGDRYDAIDAGYIMDASIIKNKGIFKDSNGRPLSSIEANRAVEKEMNATNIRMVQDFDKEDRSSDNLGIQAMAYMRVPQAIKDFQALGYQKRLEELNTSTGVLKYVFSNDMGNPYAKALDENPELINNPTIQRMVTAYTEKLWHDVSSGALVDFGLDENSKFMNERLTQDLTYQHYRTNGISDEQMAAAREKLRWGMAERYGKASDETLDEVIKDTMLLRQGNVIDYALEDFDDLSISRSPSGFDTLVHAKNRARERRALEDVFGKVTDVTGLQIGAEDAKSLSGADYDADTAKVATGVYAEMMKISAEFMHELVSNIDFDRIKSEATEGSLGSQEEADIKYIERLFSEPLGMGRGDAAGRRAVLYELNKPENRKLLRGALKGQDVYDFYSTLAKKPGKIEEDSDIIDLMNVGREYTKFTDKVGQVTNQDLINDAIKEAEKSGKEGSLNLYESKRTGLKADLNALKGLNIANTNLPSIFNDAQRMAIETVGELNLRGMDNAKSMTINEALNYLVSNDESFSGAGEWTKRLIRMKNDLLTQFSGGRTLITAEEEEAMRTVLSRSEDEIHKQALNDESLWTEKDENGNEKFIGISGAESRLRKQYGLHTIKNALDEFGMTETRDRALYGDNHAEEMKALMGNRFSLGDDISELANPSFIPAEAEARIADARARFEESKKKIEQREKSKKESKPEIAKEQPGQDSITAEIEALTKSNKKLNEEIAKFESDETEKELNAGIVKDIREKIKTNEQKIKELKALESKEVHSEAKPKANESNKKSSKITDYENERDYVYKQIEDVDKLIADVENRLSGKGPEGKITSKRERRQLKDQLNNLKGAREIAVEYASEIDSTLASLQSPRNKNNSSGNATSDVLSAMVVKDYLEEGRNLTSEFNRVKYKDKDQSYSANFFRSGSFRSGKYFEKQQQLLKDNDLTDEQKSQISNAALQSQIAWNGAAKEFAKDRSKRLYDNLFQSQSTANDVYKFSSSLTNIKSQYEEFFDIEKYYKEAVTQLGDRGVNTGDSNSVLKFVEQKRKESEPLFKRAIELLEKQFNEFYDAKTQAAQQLVDEQEEEASLKQMDLSNTSSARMYRSYLSQRKGLEKNADSIKKEYDTASNQLEGYKNDYDLLDAKDKKDLSEEDIDKMLQLEKAISKTTERVNLLRQALANANQELSNFNSVDSFKMLDETISSTTDSLRMMATGIGRSGTLDKILRIGSEMADAHEVNTAMYEKDPNKDQQEVIDKYFARENEINSWSKYYADVLRLDDSAMDHFMQQYSRGMVATPSDNINQFFNSKEYTGEQKLAELKEYLAQYEKALSEATDAAQKKIFKNRIEKIKKDIEAVTNQKNSFEEKRSDEVEFANQTALDNVNLQGLSNLYRNAQYQRNREIEDRRRSNRYNTSIFTRAYDEVMGQRNRYQTSLENDTLSLRRLETQRKQEKHALNERKDDSGFVATQTEKIKNIDDEIARLTQRIQENQQALSQYSGPAAIASTALMQVSGRVNQMLSMFGRRMFRQALNEAKQFAMQFDKAMTEIQMVTLKTDEQISQLGQSLIDTAIKYGASIQEITATTTALYRQGLSDEDVQDRLGVLTKFSKTSNVSTTDASKLLTVIMNSNMSGNAQQALDIISAISDSAPTDAVQISKTLQRSLYAASTNNVSLDQLVAMAAAITSKTQLGGATAGTTISNVINRLTKVGSGEIVYDERGNAIGKTQLSSVLSQAGIDLYEDNGTVNIFKTLTELGKWWGKNDNATIKSAITNAVSGTGRQSNNFQAMMDAFSEVDESGKTLIETFIGIADSADGIVDKKFDEHMKSIAANMAEFKSSFDQLVSSIVDTGTISSAIGFLAESIQGLTYINEITNNAIPTIIGLGAAILAITTPVGGAITAITALISVFGMLGKAAKDNTKEARIEREKERISNGENALNSLKKLNDNTNGKQSLSKEESDAFASSISELMKLGFISEDAAIKIGEMGSSGKAVAAALNEAANEITNAKENLSFANFSDWFKGFDKEYAQNQDASTLTEEEIRRALEYSQAVRNGKEWDKYETAEARQEEYDNYVKVFHAVLNTQGVKDKYNEGKDFDDYTVNLVTDKSAISAGILEDYMLGLTEGKQSDLIDDTDAVISAFNPVTGNQIGARASTNYSDEFEKGLRERMRSMSSLIITKGVVDSKFSEVPNITDKYIDLWIDQLRKEFDSSVESGEFEGTLKDWFETKGYVEENGEDYILIPKRIGQSITENQKSYSEKIDESLKKEEEDSFKTTMTNYRNLAENERNADLYDDYGKVVSTLSNSRLTAEEKLRQLSDTHVLDRLQEDAEFVKYIDTINANPELAGAIIPGVVNYAQGKQDKYKGYKTAQETAKKRRSTLSKIAGRVDVSHLDLASRTNSLALADDLSSVVGEDVVARYHDLNEQSIEFARAQIDASAAGVEAALSNLTKAEYTSDIVSKIESGVAVEDINNEYSKNLLNYLTSNVEGLSEYLSAKANGLNASIPKEKLDAEVEKLRASLEYMSEQALQWIAGLTSSSTETRSKTYSEIEETKRKNDELGEYINGPDVSYAEFSRDSNRQRVFMEALGITDTATMLRRYKDNQAGTIAELQAIYSQRSRDINNATTTTKITIPEDERTSAEKAADRSDARTVEQREYSALVDKIYGKSLLDIAELFDNDKAFTNIQNAAIDDAYAELRSTGTVTISAMQKAIKSIYENAGRASEYYEAIETQTQQINEAFDAAAKGQYNSSRHIALNLNAETISKLGGMSLNNVQEFDWLRNYAIAQVTGAPAFNKRNEASNAMALRGLLVSGNYGDAKSIWDSYSQEHQQVIDEISGNTLKSVFDGLIEMSDGTYTLSADVADDFEVTMEALLERLIAALYTGLNESVVEQWTTGFKSADSSKFWQAYSDFANTTDNKNALDKLYKRYENGDMSIASQLAQMLNIPENVVRTNKAMTKKAFDDFTSKFDNLITSFINGMLGKDLEDRDYSNEELVEKLKKVDENVATMVEDAGISIQDHHIDVSEAVGVVSAALNALISDTANDIRSSSNALNYSDLLSVIAPHTENEAFMNSGFDSKTFLQAVALQYKDNPEVMERLAGFMSNDQEFRTMQYLGNAGYLTYGNMYDYMQDRMSGTYGYNPYDYNPLWNSMFGSGIGDRTSWANNGQSIMDNMYQLYSEHPEIFDTMRGMLPHQDEINSLISTMTDETLGPTEKLNAFKDILETISKLIGTDLTEAANKGRDSLSGLDNMLSSLRNGGVDAANAAKDLIKNLNQLNDDTYSASLWKSGDRKNKNMLQYISGISGFDQDDLKKVVKGSDQDLRIQQMVDIDLQARTVKMEDTYSAALDQMVNDAVNEVIGNDSITVAEKEVILNGILTGNFDALIENINSEYGAVLAAIIAGAEATSGTITASLNGTGGDIQSVIRNAIANGKSTTQKLFNVNTQFNPNKGFGKGYSGGKSSGSGGGGGGGGNDKGKSDAEILTERLKHGRELYEHQHKMVDYDVSRFQNTDKLTMYGHALEAEIQLEKSYLPVLKDNINAIKAQMEATETGTEDWYKLRDALFDSEEKYEDITNSIEDNTKKLKENQEAIRQTRINIEQIVLDEIKKRIQQQKDMLDATISMEDEILDAIKKRYEDEWDIVRKDIDEKRKALEEEKSLINERLNKRKSAEDEALKYEELAELKRQYALISMDSSRTKEALNLRKQINDIEKEIGWDLAAREAEALSDAVQGQIDAYDQFAQIGDEDLRNLLEDANNFGAEVKRIMGLSHDEIIQWMQTNDIEYMNSLENTRQQMTENWTQMWKDMKGIVDTYWDEINEILADQDSFTKYMSQSVDYLTNSLEGQKSMLYEWTEAYDKYVKAYVDGIYKMHEAVTNVGDYRGQEGRYDSGNSPSSGGGKKSGSGSSQQKQDVIYGWDGEDKLRKTSTNSITTGVIKGGGYRFASGGEASFTGPAIIDGTFAKPERVLSSEQTESFNRLVNMLDNGWLQEMDNMISEMQNWSDYIELPESFASMPSDIRTEPSQSIGDVVINLYEAKLEDDADYEKVADQVGRLFTKELAKRGFNTTFNY